MVKLEKLKLLVTNTINIYKTNTDLNHELPNSIHIIFIIYLLFLLIIYLLFTYYFYLLTRIYSSALLILLNWA